MGNNNLVKRYLEDLNRDEDSLISIRDTIDKYNSEVNTIEANVAVCAS
tara:strand:- start:167 stop:310 length:144 start_codon:yes stop_codon:yes gene_type:complete